MIRHYTYTPDALENGLEPRRTERQEWARQWCEVIADEVGGLDLYSHQKLYLIIHELRKRVEAGDYTHPERLGPPKPML